MARGGSGCDPGAQIVEGHVLVFRGFDGASDDMCGRRHVHFGAVELLESEAEPWMKSMKHDIPTHRALVCKLPPYARPIPCERTTRGRDVCDANAVHRCVRHPLVRAPAWESRNPIEPSFAFLVAPMAPLSTDTTVLTSNQMSPTSTAVAVIILAVLIGVALVIAAVQLWVQRQRAQLARNAAAGGDIHAPGFAVVCGTVEMLDDAPFGVRIQIRQKGREWRTKHGWSHSWTETQRNVEVRPFQLTTASGAHVRVEPDARVFLVDGLDQTIDEGYAQRTRVAQLDAGETAAVSGVLLQAMIPGQFVGYRSGQQLGWTLRPHRAERMLISTEPLEQRYVRRMRLHRKWFMLLVGAALVIHGGLLLPFHVMMLSGQVVFVSDFKVRTWTTTSKGHTHRHYGVHGQYVDDKGVTHEVDDSISPYAWGQLSGNPPAAQVSLPFVVSSIAPGIYQVGTQPTGGISVVFSFALTVMSSIAYWVHTQATRAWYERKLVVETKGGRLPR